MQNYHRHMHAVVNILWLSFIHYALYPTESQINLGIGSTA